MQSAYPMYRHITHLNREKMMNGSGKFGGIAIHFILVFLVLTGACVVYLSLVLIRNQTFTDYQVTRGVVVQSKSFFQLGRLFPGIRYRFWVAGKQFEGEHYRQKGTYHPVFKNHVKKIVQNHPVGKEVRVYYKSGIIKRRECCKTAGPDAVLKPFALPLFYVTAGFGLLIAVGSIWVYVGKYIQIIRKNKTEVTGDR